MRKYEDTYRHKGLRKKLTDTLRQKGISDERVLEAINNIPRHFFLDTAFDEIAYEDRAFPILQKQTISQPYTVAYQTQLLDIKPFEKVWKLELAVLTRPAFWPKWVLRYLLLSGKKLYLIL
jgi:protein-L-isoaspartate(D-aspartate) O-methyltransferase